VKKELINWIGRAGIRHVSNSYFRRSLTSPELSDFRRQRLLVEALSCKFCSAFRASAIDYLSACFCCHSSTETMGSCAFEQAWLESSFHRILSMFNI